MKCTEYLFFAALLTPTAAVLVAAAISLAAPETDRSTSEAVRSEVVADYGRPGGLEQQP